MKNFFVGVFCLMFIVASFTISNANGEFNKSLSSRKGSIEASAGFGVTDVVADNLNPVQTLVIDTSTFDNTETYSASLLYWVGNSQTLGLTVSSVRYGSQMTQVDLGYRYNFRTNKSLVPFIGLNVGAVNEGLVVDENKLTLGAQLGATYYFDRVGIYVESRSHNIFDKDLTNTSVNTVLGRVGAGIVLLAR